jgi:predicted DNA-binding transcriptional regulator AlpA
MRLLDKKEAGALVGYHPEHLMRLARERKFPRPIKLGDSPASAVRWDYGEIEEWFEKRKAARTGAPAGADN